MKNDSVCDGCGGLLPAADFTGNITCPSCGRITTVDRGIDPPAEKVVDFSTWTPGPGGTSNFDPISTVDFSGATATVVRTSKIGCGIGSVVALIGLIIGIAAVVIAVRNGIDSVTSVTDKLGSSSSSRYYPSGGSSFVVRGGEGSTTDLVTFVTDNKGSDSSRKLVRVQFSSGDPKVVWASESFPSDVYDVEMAVTGDNLYVGAKDEVRLLSLATGKESWNATLTDKITTGCSTCFATVSGKLVVRTDDAYLTGLGPASPEQLWSKRLSSVGAKPSVVGNLVLVVDQETGKDTEVQNIDPATGKVNSTISPKCAPPDGQYYPVTMSSGNRVYGVPGTADLVSAFGFSGGCVVRWDSVSNAVRWAAYTGDMTPSSDQPPIISARDLVFGGSAGMVHIDLNNGAAAELAPVADSTSVPRAFVGRTLLAETTTTRGTSKGGVGAWDLNTNAHLWTTPLPRGSQPASQTPYGNSDALFDGSPRSVLVTGGNQPRLVTFTGEGRTYTDQTIDMTNGTLSQPVKKNYESRNGGSGTPSLTVEDVLANRLVVSVDGLIQVVPIGSEGAIVRWPN